MGINEDDGHDPSDSPDPRDRLAVRHREAFTTMCNANETLQRAMASKEAAADGSPEAADAAAAFEAALASVLDAVKKLERIGAAFVRAAGPPAVPEGAERTSDVRRYIPSR